MQRKRTLRKAPLCPRPLSGLIGISVILVACSLFGVPFLANGIRMYSVLLVVAAYLTTCAVTRSFDENEGLGIGGIAKFWGRLLRRVWPALLCVVVFVSVVCAALNAGLLATMKPDVLPTLGLFVNWTDYLRNVTPGSSASPLGGMWLIAVGMQLALVWATVAAPLLRLKRALVRRITLFLALVGLAWLMAQCVLGGNLVRVSLATDTRLGSFLLGAWLAFAFPMGRVPSVGKQFLLRLMDGQRGRRRRYQATPLANVLGLVSLAGMLIIVTVVPAGGTQNYGLIVVCMSVLAIILTATLLAPGSWLGRFLSLAPFTWLGSRGLSIYLWLYPLHMLISAGNAAIPWYMQLAALAASLAAGELTYRMVELPFMSVDDAGTSRPVMAPYRLAATALVVIIAGVFGARALITLPTETANASERPSATSTLSTTPTSTEATSDDTSDDSLTTTSDASSSTSESDSDADTPSAKKGMTLDSDTQLLAPTSETRSGMYDPVLIGDSVPGDADWSRVPDALIDTYIGRRPDQALEVVRGYLDQQAVGSIVVLACFSNVTPTPGQLDSFAELLGDDRQIYLVGTVNPDGFMDEANANLKDACDRHANMHYIDWPAVEKDHDKEYLWDDVTHLRPEGGVVYVDMVLNAIAQDLIDAGGTTK